MTEDLKPPPAGGGSTSDRGAATKWNALIAVAFAVVAGAAIYGITHQQSGGTIALGTSGVSIAFNANDRFEHLVERAMRDEPRTFRAILSEFGVYAIDDIRLVDRLRSGPLPEPVRDGVRRLLYDLDGPFAPPGTLAGADVRFYRALEELEKEIRVLSPDTPEALANPFFAQLWMHQLDQSGIFVPRLFDANVAPLADSHPPEDGIHFVYVCSGSELEDRTMVMQLNEPDRPRYLIEAIARVDLLRFNCSEGNQSLPRYLARHSARMGLPKETVESLFRPDGRDTSLPAPARAVFQLAPRHYRPAGPPPTAAMN